ncbi:MAG: hypothetical protein ACLGHY_03445, partial [Gammaproteobacteria bacterium]
MDDLVAVENGQLNGFAGALDQGFHPGAAIARRFMWAKTALPGSHRRMEAWQAWPVPFSTITPMPAFATAGMVRT